MQETNTPSPTSLQGAAPFAHDGISDSNGGTTTTDGNSGRVPLRKAWTDAERMTPDTCVHVLRSVAKLAEGHARAEGMDEATSLRLQSVADRLRLHAERFADRLNAP